MQIRYSTASKRQLQSRTIVPADAVAYFRISEKPKPFGGSHSNAARNRKRLIYLLKVRDEAAAVIAKIAAVSFR